MCVGIQDTDLEDTVDAVGDMEAVRPVVVDHGPVVGPHGEDEGDEGVVVVSLHTEQVGKHEQRFPDLHHITQTCGVVGKSKNEKSLSDKLTDWLTFDWRYLC